MNTFRRSKKIPIITRNGIYHIFKVFRQDLSLKSGRGATFLFLLRKGMGFPIKLISNKMMELQLDVISNRQFSSKRGDERSQNDLSQSWGQYLSLAFRKQSVHHIFDIMEELLPL